ncbi:prepilin-type N-terminal cleavage/methylation domain-containing protein [Roseibacillus persicicus]|uniref:Prepilin-type N-terminal cleavage/methylation domain-containing protein n=1 Tax=Roseibacillus persicicus TaxID=454148 RepID=A0A918TB48_9BACT|nr:prepilin-type N-terminal cleavage/methylation domain-containing protein [Roseibacillus persicicus]GHC40745.1 hypothetical protein GCM10007100_01600 [Roseibacillus persicicus]
MKLTNTKTNKSNKGMTLIELTVVILVLLSLISVLFIGARAWMRGSDRANAALLIRNAQQGVRSHSNIMGVETPATGAGEIAWPAADDLSDEIFGPGKYVETATISTPPTHPAAGNSFIAAGTDFDSVPELGSLYMTSNADAAFYAPSGVQ